MREAIVSEARTAAKWSMVGIVAAAVIELAIWMIARWPV
jgi:hypothetical protein